MNKLIMINVTNHRYPYGTILSVKEESRHSYLATVAEKGNMLHINKVLVKEI